jgi:hypothetical protein
MERTKQGMIVIACLLTSTTALADVAYETAQFGGSGGQEYESECVDGFAKGLTLRAATYIDRIGLRCVDPRSGNVVSSNTRFGGTGGNAYTTTCKTGYVLKGLQGRSARLVDRLNLVCVEEATVFAANDTSSERLDYNYSSFGGDGGQYFSVRCGGGDAAVGIHGAAATYVDRVGLWCKDTGN